MAKKARKLFPKPTGIAVAAAVLGLAIHGAIFFLIEIRVESPERSVESPQAFTFLGESDPETIALIDPLTLLIGSTRAMPGPGMEDFRTLSVSREISSFPPFLTLENNRHWRDWITESIPEENPGAWLLERTESSLQNFGREGLPDLALPPDRMTVRIVDLLETRPAYLTVPMPSAVLESSRGKTFLNPATFLFDRTSRWSRAEPLLVESSGDEAVDEALRSTLITLNGKIPVRSDYSLVTYYLPPPPPAAESQP